MQKSWERMKEICDFIGEYQFQYCRTPTLDKIAEAVGTVKSNIHKYLDEMQSIGMIRKCGREIEIVSGVQSSPKLNRVPILGNISCGMPDFAEENFEEYIPLPVALFGEGDFFLLRAKGYSMIGVGIGPGDLVVVRKQKTANEGDIVVALAGNETTLKRYYIDRERKCIRLHPENEEMEDIFVKECMIQGVAEHVIKAL